MAPKNPAKAKLYANALDEAQQQARWSDQTPARNIGHGLTWSELLRKFAKHNPEKELEATVAETEQIIRRQLLDAAGREGFDGDSAHEDDFGLASFPRGSDPTRGTGVHKIISPPILKNSGPTQQVEDALAKLRRTLKASESGHVLPEAKLAALIVCALGELSIGRNAAALVDLQACPPNVSSPSGHLADLLVMSFVLQGFVREQQNDPTQAVGAYAQAITAYDNYRRACPTDSSVELQKWGEIAYYRHALLSRSTDPTTSLDSHRSYKFDHLPRKRLALLRSHVDLLYASSTPSLAEIRDIQGEQERILRKVTRFPRAGEVNSRMLDFVDRVYQGWELFKSRLEGDEFTTETLRVIGIHERALSYTFHSHRLLRHLVELKMSAGYYKQAVKPLELYIRLWEKARETDLIDVTLQMLQFKRTGQKHEEKIPTEKTEVLDKVAKDEEQIDIDSTHHYVNMCCVGARLYCKYVTGSESALRAVQLAERAIELLQEGEGVTDSTDAGRVKTTKAQQAMAQQWRGIARSALAFVIADPETRPDNQKLGLTALMEAAKLEPQSFEALYHLAYVQAEQRDISAATKTIRRSLQIAPTRQDAYHLLVLLISADKKSNVAALQAADIALGISNGHSSPSHFASLNPSSNLNSRYNDTKHDQSIGASLPSDQESVQPSGSTGSEMLEASAIDQTDANNAGQEDDNVLHTDKRAASSSAFPDMLSEFELRITRNVLLEAVRGPKEALRDQRDIFEAYAQSFAQYKPARSEPVPPRTQAPIPSIKAPSIVATLKARARKSSSAAQNSPALNGDLLHPTRSRTNSIASNSSQAIAHQEPNGAASDAPTSSQSQSASPPGSYASSVVHIIQGVADSNAASDDWQNGPEIDGEEARDGSLESHRLAHARRLEQKLWLLSAATYRRAGDLDDARDAVEEAGRIDDENPDVWVQIALLQLAAGDTTQALQCLDKACYFDIDHTSAVVHAARLLLEQGGQSVALAEGLLDILTQTNGWDVPEAWYLLSRVYELTDRQERALDCLQYALQLEETKPIRDIRLALPRVL